MLTDDAMDIRTASPVQVSCPICNMRTGETTCTRCNEDLSSLHAQCRLAVASYNLGLHLIQKHGDEMQDHAVECMQLAISISPSFVEPYILLGKLYTRKQKYAVAIEYWGKVLTIDPRNQEITSCMNVLRLGMGEQESMVLEANWKGKPIRFGADTHFTDGYSGMVWRLITDGKRNTVTHMTVLVQNFFWEKISIPASYISAINGNEVFISRRLHDVVYRSGRRRMDENLLSRLKEALSSSEKIAYISASPMSIEVSNGDVRLEGSVPSSDIGLQIEEIVKSVDGVGQVDNAFTYSTIFDPAGQPERHQPGKIHPAKPQKRPPLMRALDILKHLFQFKRDKVKARGVISGKGQ